MVVFALPVVTPWLFLCYSLRIFTAEKLQAQTNDKEVHIILNRGGAWWYVNKKEYVNIREQCC